jgi:hypothetical protein
VSPEYKSKYRWVPSFGQERKEERKKERKNTDRQNAVHGFTTLFSS